MLSYFPVVWSTNGLSDGIVPSELRRRIFPKRIARLWALAPLALSPTAT